MFGSGLLKGLGVTLKHFADTFTDDRQKVPTLPGQPGPGQRPPHHRTADHAGRPAYDSVSGGEAPAAGALPLHSDADLGH